MHINILYRIRTILRSVPEGYLWLPLLIFAELTGYLLINNLTRVRVPYTLALHTDALLPFIPSFSIFYVMEWILGFLPFLLLKDKKMIRLTTMLYLGVMALSYFFFLAFPVQMLRPEIIPQTATGHLVAFIYGIDLPYNTFPSLHIILMLLSGLILLSVRNPAAPFVLLMFFPVSLSTLLIKQHYVLDVLAGVVIAAIAFLVFIRYTPLAQKRPEELCCS